MDISNAELKLPQNLLPVAEPIQKNEAVTRDGVPESEEAEEHDQKNYESGHSEITRKSAASYAVTITHRSEPATDVESADQTAPPESPDLRLFDRHGRIAPQPDGQIVDVVL